MNKLSVLASEEKAKIIEKAFLAGYQAAKDAGHIYFMTTSSESLEEYLEEVADAENNTRD